MSKSQRKSSSPAKKSSSHITSAKPKGKKSSPHISAGKPKGKSTGIVSSKFFQTKGARGKSVNDDKTSPLSITLLCILIAVLVIGGTLVFDSTNNWYLVRGASHWLGINSSEYASLPMNTGEAPGPTPKGMAWIPGGWFWMGSEDLNHPDSNPIHKVYVDGFWMDKTEVTNAEWQEFIADTNYKTVAEKKPDPKQFPAHLKEVVEKQNAFSLVFTPPAYPVRNLKKHLQWWKGVEGADWRHPHGPQSSIEEKEKHPVVHVCWLDALQFIEWKNKKYPAPEGFVYRLPTEAEWEFAARGGKNLKKFTWGDELKPGGKFLGNIWQGKFPNQNTKEDGYITTAPVASYPPNGFGLYDMAGNVWEWCHDYYRPNYYKDSEQKNPIGPMGSYDPNEVGLPKRVQRGGSFLCHVSYCERYLTYARGKGEITSSANHVGFRVVLGKKLERKELSGF